MRAKDYATFIECRTDGEYTYDWYEVDPDKMYPAFLEYCKKLAAGADYPACLELHVQDARGLKPDAWDIALLPKGARQTERVA